MLDKLNPKYIFLIAIFVLAGGSISCSKKSEIPASPKIPAMPTAPTPVPVEEKPKEVYLYGGDKFRDIFTPAGSSANYQAEAVFDPTKATIKGIIYSARLKTAVLTVLGNGSYYVKDGKIFDIMGKVVKGVTAKILPDRVVLTNESENVFEIKLKNDAEEARNL